MKIRHKNWLSSESIKYIGPILHNDDLGNGYLIIDINRNVYHFFTFNNGEYDDYGVRNVTNEYIIED